MDGDGSDVEKRSRERVSSGLLQAISLDDIAVGIAELVALVKEQLPEGKVLFTPLTATPDLQEMPLDPPWFSVDIVNDGPVPVLVTFNDATDPPAEIRTGENPRFDFQRPVLHTVYYRTAERSTSFRLFGTR